MLIFSGPHLAVVGGTAKWGSPHETPESDREVTELLLLLFELLLVLELELFLTSSKLTIFSSSLLAFQLFFFKSIKL